MNMEKTVDTEYRKLVVLILKASTQIAVKHRRGPANFVRVPDSMIDKFSGREIAGIPVHGDIELQNTIIVGRFEESGFLVEETINI